jgi:hypothetical protein
MIEPATDEILWDNIWRIEGQDHAYDSVLGGNGTPVNDDGVSDQKDCFGKTMNSPESN